jgi:hypothetical protein
MRLYRNAISFPASANAWAELHDLACKLMTRDYRWPTKGMRPFECR